MAERNLFGTDGIRGRANVYPMTAAVALQLGRAITRVARRNRRRSPRIVIGKDTRLSGYMLEQALAAGVCSMGGTVLLTGPIPTPAVANLTQSMRADAGVVISASHNPYEDNGIKVFASDGFKLPDAEEAEIERLMAELDPHDAGEFVGDKVGRAERIDDAAGRYVVYAKSTFPKELTLEDVRIVVDAAHGAAYKVAPAVFEELGAKVTVIGGAPNGRNINDGCGALHPQHVAAEVRRQEAHIGIALDGDADRVIVVDERGEVVDGDALMAICARGLLAAGKLGKQTVVSTVMSNIGLERALSRLGAKLVRTAVGDRYVVEEMRAQGYTFGGEQSGHLIFLEHATTGDGVVAALQVLAIMVAEQRALSDLSSLMERVPQILKSVKLPSRRPIDTMPTLTAAIAGTAAELGDEGRVLVRWSGTEALLRIMVEGPDTATLERMCDELAAAARRDLG